MPSGSYIDISDFSTITDLVDYLLELDADPVAYERYHAWRHASFDTYGIFFRRELLRFIAIAHYSTQKMTGVVDTASTISRCVRCAMCYSLNDWSEASGWSPPFDGKVMPAKRILPFTGSCRQRWNSSAGSGVTKWVPSLPDYAAGTVVRADEFYGRHGVQVPAVVAERKLRHRDAP